MSASTHRIDLFLIGAQKAGSTTLFSWLSQHPEINAPESIKDFHFFISEEYFPKGYSWFEGLYGEKENHTKRLHGAVNYIFREDAAKKISNYNPNAKLIVVLRNPIKRAFSAYQFFKKLGNEERSFEQAVREEQEGYLKTEQEKDDYAYLAHGLYAKQIKNWLSYYKQEQFFIVLYEELFMEPMLHLRRIFEFAGITDTAFSVNLYSKNISGKVKYPWLNKLIYKPDSIVKKGLNITKMKNLIPMHWRGKLLGSFRDWNTKPGSSSEKISEEMYQYLLPLFEEDKKELELLINKKLDLYWKY